MSDAERRRLLYVACTRAVDHLVVSLHRPPPAKNNPDGADQGKLDLGRTALVRAVPPDPPSGARLGDVRTPAGRSADRGRRSNSTGAIRTAGPRSGAASSPPRHADPASPPPGWPPNCSPHVATDRPAATTSGLDKQPVNIEQPPWQRGRYGTSIGRAVHGVLQFCDLDDGHDIATLARAQCAAEGVIGLEEQVAALARSALAHADRAQRRRRARALARAVRGRHGRRPRARGLRRSAGADTRAASSSSTTRPTSGPGRSRPANASSATGCSSPRTVPPSSRRSASRSPAASSCAASPMVPPTDRRSTGGPTRSREVRQLVS